MATVYTLHSNDSESEWRSQSHEASSDVSPSLDAESAGDDGHFTLSFRDEYHRDTSPSSQIWSSFATVSSSTAPRTSDDNQSTTSNLRSRSGRRNRKNHSPIIQPQKALIRKDEQVLYQAAWYHRLLPDPQEARYSASWWNQCKLEWNQSFWELAQHDETLREVFLSFAAAKEAAVRGSESSQGYYLHKGRALSLIREDVAREGSSLRRPAIAAITLLFMIAFVEGDFDAAQTHLRAIAPLITANLLSARNLPVYFWLILTWADLRLTAIDSCPPMFPYSMHPDFDVKWPSLLEMRVTAMAKWNAPNLPTCRAFRPKQAVDVLEKLYAFMEIHNQPDLPWRMAYSVSYQTAFQLASEYSNLEQSSATEDPEDHERVRTFLLAARILLWFSMNKFVTQGGIQRHLLYEIMPLISDKMPAELCFQWAKHASLDVLLWVLFATYVSFVRIRGTPFEGSVGWLQTTLKMTVKRLHLTSYSAYVARLRRLPFASSWVSLACTSFTWIDGGPLVKDYDARPSSLFALMRLTFDPMTEVDRAEGHRPLEEIDSLNDNAEARCTACIEKVRTSSQELFHFSQKKG